MMVEGLKRTLPPDQRFPEGWRMVGRIILVLALLAGIAWLVTHIGNSIPPTYTPAQLHQEPVR